MAIKGDVTTRGELSVIGAYIRVVNPRIETTPAKSLFLHYDVLTYKNKTVRDANGDVLSVPTLTHFKCSYTLPAWPLVWPLLKPSDPPDNVFSLAYKDLKSRNLIANQEDV